MSLKGLYEKLIEKAREKEWNIEDLFTKEQLPNNVMKFIRLSRVSTNNKYEAKIIIEFKEERELAECLYSVWERKENEKEFKEGTHKPEEIVKFALSQEEKIENYLSNLMEELNKKYFTTQFTRIRSKT
ncbi:MAG: hypothetical protein QW622_02765 [Candidatus Pacearchaeota archaeon]